MCCWYLVAAVVGLLTSGPAVAQVTATWNGSAGNWSEAARWSTNPLFPNNGNGGNTYNAVVGAGNATLDQAITIQGLTFGGGTITRTNDLTVNAVFTWNGGTLAGAGTLTVAGGGTGTNNGMIASGGLVRFGDGATPSTFAQGDGVSLILNNAAQVSVRNAATYVVSPAGFQSEFRSSVGTPGTFTVEAGGTLRKTGTGTHLIDSGVGLNNSGTIDVQQGTFGVAAGTFPINAGTVRVASEATFQGAVNNTGTGLLTGAGTVTGAVNVQTSGRISAGTGVGATTLTLQTGLTMANDAGYEVRLFGTGTTDISRLARIMQPLGQQRLVKDHKAIGCDDLRRSDASGQWKQSVSRGTSRRRVRWPACPYPPSMTNGRGNRAVGGSRGARAVRCHSN